MFEGDVCVFIILIVMAASEMCKYPNHARVHFNYIRFIKWQLYFDKVVTNKKKKKSPYLPEIDIECFANKVI